MALILFSASILLNCFTNFSQIWFCFLLDDEEDYKIQKEDKFITILLDDEAERRQVHYYLYSMAEDNKGIFFRSGAVNNAVESFKSQGQGQIPLISAG